MVAMAEIIRAKLEAAFAPERLEIQDDSHRHAGHAGASEGGESHFSVTVVSSGFAGLSRVERQRRVYNVLADEMKDRIHALALKTATPEETA